MVRVRNLVLAIAAATALTSEMAYALGLGEVTLKSALNQPLLAEIELLDAKTLAPGEVVPVLASAEDFNRAGVDRQFFLTDLTFTPIVRPGGKSVIQVSSTKPVREPYLNFLIEVLWPSGRLLREYTLLLDPPLYSPEIAAAVAPQLPVAAPIVRRSTAPQQATPPAAASAESAVVAGEEYKVTPNDTLWEIAERARQGGTVHQTMLAIQDLNPDAFIGNNINRMKNGQVHRHLEQREELDWLTAHQRIHQPAPLEALKPALPLPELAPPAQALQLALAVSQRDPRPLQQQRQGQARLQLAPGQPLCLSQPPRVKRLAAPPGLFQHPVRLRAALAAWRAAHLSAASNAVAYRATPADRSDDP